VDRVFLDANVLFSAAYRESNGLLRFWSLTDAVLVSSPYAIDEARRNLTDPDAGARLDKLLGSVSLVPEASPTASLPIGVNLPAKDVPILLAAIAGQASHLLTGDVRHFGPLFGQTIEGVLILLPADYRRETTP
jgi:hypothetical protein